ncbi:MAG: PAS domain-containing sensor histidine kinase [Micavibrio aeruginosavorus]|uniref:histidine kinase n=1 Tax=Micavibrio aeruginosavorus TaxID=349221 RepID=A0A2W5HM95_9BACT|nr:MAG: PAS domain-containing sensor histidine kinase [Micavibrio aeruginosavorus]
MMMAKQTHNSTNRSSQLDIWTWLKDHMVHIMVLANGIILTVASFWTVQLFVSQILKDDYQKSGASTKQVVVEKIKDFHDTMADFTLAFQNYSLNEAGSFVISPVTARINTKGFDSILWIPLETPSLSLDLKDTNFSDQKITVNTKIVSAILNQAKSQPDIFLYIADTTRSAMHEEKGIVQTRSFAIVKAVKNVQQKTIGYLAGFTAIDKVLNREQILSTNYVSKTVFWDNSSKAILFFLEDTKGDFISIGQNFQYNFEVVFANKPIQVQVVFKKTSNSILELLSWLIAGFGIVVTVIVWFYVSNNFNKSKILSKVNADLAEKNEELNDQIREREKLFQTLRKSERENYAIINAISDAIFEVSPSGDIMFLNEAWTKITGFDLETSMGGNIIEMIFPPDQEEQKLNIALLAKGQRTAYRVLTKLRTIDGTCRSVEMVVSMLRQDEARNLRVMGSFTDVEERQRAEQALNEAERKYKTIWENAAGGIYQLTSEGQFLSANPALARIFGYDTPEDMVRLVHNAHEDLFVDPQDRAQYLKSRSSGTANTSFYEAKARRRDGEEIWVRENFRAVLDGFSNVLYYEGSIEDITQRKEGEVQLKEAKMHSDMASRAKSEFLANISHELRTPLNSIIGFSEIIKNEVFGPIEPKSYTEYAGNIYDSGKHLLGIINQILDISRIDAGERELNESMVDIRKITSLCLDLSKSKINQNNLTVIDMVPDNLPKMIAEEVAVKQMLLNLLSNAAKFTPVGGRITLNAEIESSGNLKISVTDTGVGLSQEQIDRATKPFGLVDGRLDKGTGGAGLGLSLVHSLLKLHGGKLEILSQKGIGTTASLIFPASRIQ